MGTHRSCVSRCLFILSIAAHVLINCRVSASSPEGPSSKEGSPKASDDDADTILDLGLGQGAFIGVCVAVGVVILIIPIICCFCCGCLCFAYRKKPPPTTNISTGQQQSFGQGQAGVETKPSNNYPGAYQQQQSSQQQNMAPYGQPAQPNSFGQPQQQPFFNQSNPPQYPPNNSPVPTNNAMYPDSYGPRFDSRNTHPTDPNLVVNRFNNKPIVPPKPSFRQKFPGWTNVTKEVKKRNQLKQIQDHARGYDYDNDAYDGGEPIAPTSPTNNNINSNSNANQQDNNFSY